MYMFRLAQCAFSEDQIHVTFGQNVLSTNDQITQTQDVRIYDLTETSLVIRDVVAGGVKDDLIWQWWRHRQHHT